MQRDFAASRPNEKWVCDLTYLRTWSGFLYLAFNLDCYSRMIVGWQLAAHMRTELVLDALAMANGLRRPDAGLIAHSVRGSQYTSIRYTGGSTNSAPHPRSAPRAMRTTMRWPKRGSRPSRALVDGRASPPLSTPSMTVLHWIGFYNGERLHEALGDLAPVEYEELNVKRDNSAIVAAT